MESLESAVRASSGNQKLVDALFSLTDSDLDYVVPLLERLHAHTKNSQHIAARAQNFTKAAKSVKLPSRLLGERLQSCRGLSDAESKKSYSSSQAITTDLFMKDKIFLRKPVWPIEEFRSSLRRYEQESGKVISFEALRNKDSVSEGDVKAWTTVNVLHPVVHLMDDWLQHHLRKTGDDQRARLSYRGEYCTDESSGDTVDHAIMLHRGEGVPDEHWDPTTLKFDRDAMPLVLWEDKALGFLKSDLVFTSEQAEGELEVSQLYYHTYGRLASSTPQLRKYVFGKKVPYILHGDSRVVVGMAWDGHCWGMGQTANVRDFKVYNRKNAKIGKLNRIDGRMEHHCQVVATFSERTESSPIAADGELSTRELTAFFIWMALKDHKFDL